ncbi:hypothetical protein ERJ75_001816400 [Trypanosoma vivax]|nr:hypothetical protein ERJ75_001816400 [Trypanosoma vivax]
MCVRCALASLRAQTESTGGKRHARAAEASRKCTVRGHGEGKDNAGGTSAQVGQEKAGLSAVREQATQYQIAAMHLAAQSALCKRGVREATAARDERRAAEKQPCGFSVASQEGRMGSRFAASTATIMRRTPREATRGLGGTGEGSGEGQCGMEGKACDKMGCAGVVTCRGRVTCRHRR